MKCKTKKIKNMAINTYLSIIKSKKQNKQAEQKQPHRYREHFDGGQMGGVGEKGEEGEGTEKYRLAAAEESRGYRAECSQ